MKRRHLDPGLSPELSELSLCQALLSMRTVTEIRQFLADLCTPAEREAMRDRWRVVPHLLAGDPYREIHERTAVSITTIGRVARCIEEGSGGYKLAASRMQAAEGRAA